MTRFTLHPALRSLSILASLTLACELSACAAPITISRAALPCSSLVPSQLSDDTPGADLPTGSTIGDWIAFGDAQTGALDKANLTKGAALQIVKACETRDASIDASLTKRKKILSLF